MAFILTIAEGKGRGQKFQFDAERVTIGRGAENDVVLNDAGVSRNHARIERQTAGWMLLDNGSANGTELNGAVIQKPSQLRAGDRIGVGPVTFEFAAEADPAATRITAAPKREQETRISAMPAAQARSIEPQAGAAARKAGGAAQLWGQLPLYAKIAVVAGAALIVVGVARTAVQGREQRGLACPDTVAVDDDTQGYSFGHGEVDVDCGGKVTFGFNASPQTRVLFHYAPMHVGSPSELELRVNGKHLAWAPVAGGHGEQQVLTLPQDALSPDGRNFVQLTDSQRGKEWAVGKVRVEMLAITAGDLVAAKQAYDRGRRKLEERRIAPRNLYDAWKAFTEARRQMEGLAQKPALYAEVAQLIKDAERDLEKECGKLIFSAARFERYGQDEKAQQTYREVLLHFPGEDPTACRKKAQENIVSAQAAEAAE
jgi:type III secretion system (T3SS) inner membrane Yop/YscD-like protein